METCVTMDIVTRRAISAKLLSELKYLSMLFILITWGRNA